MPDPSYQSRRGVLFSLGQCSISPLSAMQKSSDVLSNQLQVSSAHATLWDGEAIFWTQCILSNLWRSKQKLGALLQAGEEGGGVREGTGRGVASSLAGTVFGSPVSVVTTVETSDWSLQVRVDSPSLLSKGPVMRGVMAACVGHVQWSLVDDHTSSIRSVTHTPSPSLNLSLALALALTPTPVCPSLA